MKKFLIIVCLVVWGLVSEAQAKVNIFAYSRPAPETKVYDSLGKSVGFADYRGDFIIAVFWSKTCIPCLREMPDLKSFVQKTEGNGIKVMLISSEKEWISANEQEELLKKHGGDGIAHFVDRKSALANEFGIFSSPHSVLINVDGMEIGRIRGAVDWDDEEVIEYIYKLRATH